MRDTTELWIRGQSTQHNSYDSACYNPVTQSNIYFLPVVQNIKAVFGPDLDSSLTCSALYHNTAKWRVQYYLVAHCLATLFTPF